MVLPGVTEYSGGGWYFLEAPSARWMPSALRLSSRPRGPQASSCGLSRSVAGLLIWHLTVPRLERSTYSFLHYFNDPRHYKNQPSLKG